MTIICNPVVNIIVTTNHVITRVQTFKDMFMKRIFLLFFFVEQLNINGFCGTMLHFCDSFTWHLKFIDLTIVEKI